MRKIRGVDFLQGDFRKLDVLAMLLKKVNGRKMDIVLSDMSPNISGVVCVDVCKSIYLCKLVLNICEYILMSGGSLLVKIFQGEGFDEYCRSVRCLFNTVRIRKPLASHIRSREVYIVAKGYNI